jgi:hypothetical protein
MSQTGHSRNFNQERAVECLRLVNELSDFTEELNAYELKWIMDYVERYDKYGENTVVTDNQYSWLAALYERVIG